MKTQAFPLCKFFPPDKMNKWISVLTFLTRYEDFVRPGSESDLEYGCHLTLFQINEALLKIIIRPNLQVVLQIGLFEET